MYVIKNEYENLVKQYHTSLYRLLYTYCRNACDAEDAVQTAYLRLLRSKKVFLSEQHAKNWLYTVGVNYVKDLQKSKWRQNDPLEADIPFETEQQEELYEAISELDDKYRMVILLYYYEGYSVKEIAHMLNSNSSTIQTRLQRGREQLRVRLEE